MYVSKEKKGTTICTVYCYTTCFIIIAEEIYRGGQRENNPTG